MEQHTFDLLGSESDYVCEDKEYEVIYEVEGGKVNESKTFYQCCYANL